MPESDQSNDLKALLKQAKDLSTLNEDQMDELVQNAQEINVKRGAFVWRINDPVTNIFLLVKGLLHVQMQGGNGDQTITGLVPPFSIVGEAEVFSQESRYFNQVIAAEPCYLLVLSKPTFLKLVKDNAEFACYWLRLANLKFLGTLQQIHTLRIGPPRVRLARTLLLLNRWRIRTGVDERIPLSQQILGLHAGLSRQVVSTILSEWNKKGIIDIGYGWIKLANLKALITLAEDA